MCSYIIKLILYVKVTYLLIKISTHTHDITPVHVESNGHLDTGCSLNIVFFSLNFVIFLNSASSGAALVFYLPGVCTHTDTEGKQRKARVRNILKS